jgi:hypothetical protein
LIAGDVEAVLADLDDHLPPVAALERVKQRPDGLWTHLHRWRSPRSRIGTVGSMIWA